ncbi:MAG: hypothetical protein WC791_00415 [Candidatus Paceibacterota bacterium]|jgi:hypothetical protein
MKSEQTKTLIVNILTACVVIGVIVAAYSVFVKNEIPVVSSISSSASSVAQIAEETALMGAQIDTTVGNLNDLAKAVANSNVVFELPAFKNLRDFSVVIPEESVGRANPFVPTVWKINMTSSLSSGTNTVTPASETTSPSNGQTPATPPSSGI